MNTTTYEITGISYDDLFSEYKDIITTYECSEMLRISAATVRKYVKQGKLKALAIPGKMLIIKKSVIEYCIKCCKAA